MLGIYVLSASRFLYLHIFWQRCVPFPMLCRSKEEIRSSPFVARWLLIVWLACLVSVAGRIRISTPLPPCNIISKKHLWYTIFIGISWPHLVPRRTQKLAAWENYRFGKLLLLTPSFCCFHLPRVLDFAVLATGIKPSQEWTRRPYTCVILLKLAKPSSVLAACTLFGHIGISMPDLPPLLPLIQPHSVKQPPLTELIHVALSSLPYVFTTFPNCAPFWLGNPWWYIPTNWRRLEDSLTSHKGNLISVVSQWWTMLRKFNLSFMCLPIIFRALLLFQLPPSLFILSSM